MTLLVRNVDIYDGGVGEPTHGDIFISRDKISAIGDIPARHVNEIIEGQNIKVCPGFIDAFSKTDHYLGILDEPEQKEFLKNGITTVIGGQEGISLAPLFPGNLDLIEEWTGRHRNLGWHSVQEFLGCLSQLPLGINFGTFIGYETVRRVFPASKKKFSKAESAFIQKIIKTALAEGGMGVSYKDNPKIIIPLNREIVPARTFLPDWINSNSPRKIKETLRDDWLQAKVIRDVSNFDPKNFIIVQAPGHDSFVGKTLYQISQIFRLKDFKTALIKLLIFTECRALVAYPKYTPEKLSKELTRSDILLGTAGTSFSQERKPKLIFPDENTSALSNFISFALSRGIMSLAEAINKITAVPAQALKIKKRGKIKEGNFADIVGFSISPDSNEISIKFVILNGKLVMRDGEFMGSAGRVLLPK